MCCHMSCSRCGSGAKRQTSSIKKRRAVVTVLDMRDMTTDSAPCRDCGVVGKRLRERVCGVLVTLGSEVGLGGPGGGGHGPELR